MTGATQGESMDTVQPGKFYVNSDGNRPARIYAIDGLWSSHGDPRYQPIHGAIYDNGWRARVWTLAGNTLGQSGTLIEVSANQWLEKLRYHTAPLGLSVPPDASSRANLLATPVTVTMEEIKTILAEFGIECGAAFAWDFGQVMASVLGDRIQIAGEPS